MKRNPASRLLAFVLALVMVLGLLPLSGAAAGLVWHETDLTLQPDLSHRLVTDTEPEEFHAPAETVRVSIVLEDAPTAGAGFATKGIALDEKAVAYDQALSRTQKAMEQTISTQALGGKKLDVVWNLTLVANIISANVPYGSLDAIRAVPGVREVRLERQYSPETVEPQTYNSGTMTGAASVWQSGYTGAGSRVAIVDTGTDTDHQSFDNGAFVHALKQNAAERNLSYDNYLKTIDLLDTGDVNKVLRQLNVTERIGYEDASSYYLSEKLPFAANYVDRNLVVDHDHDYQGSHGSHVAGIAAANRFIPSPKGSGYVDALQEVSMAGAAPDAQILTMKVFGNAEGPYDSDYFAAIEDAIWLGCDSVNLSLGAGNPGSSYNDVFADLLEFLQTTDTVVVMSAGNSGRWADHTAKGELYADGVSFHTSGEPGTYTNSLSVASVNGESGSADRDDYVISSFSSWGVPGSLKLKPEIAAPGGNIWSVNGVDPSGKAYEYMSGTSMAAPQITGLTAQLTQYIREQGLEEKTGLSPRQLAQSLLMSTAVPLRDQEAGGSYYPVMAQGAGFARVDLATSAGSFVLVEDQPDGKVKAELGEDAQRRGSYSFTFTIHNLTDQPMTYDLRTDLFTQAIYNGGDARYLDTATRALDAQTVYAADGRLLESMGDLECDLNGDGVTNADDADHLLEYLLGNVQKLHADGDLDGNGQITSYDAHLLLSRQVAGHEVQVAAKGSVQVEVMVRLSDSTRTMLEQEYPAGAYIEGYVYAEPENGVTHSIPMLGYYGSWTDPSMFDVGGWLEQEAGAETRKPYLYELLGIQSNYLSISGADGKEYLFGGNPYVEESEYLPRRNAFNNLGDEMLQHLRFSLIRNASHTRLSLKNLTTGEELFSEEFGAYGGAYYHANTGYWMDTQHRFGVGLGLEGIPENTALELRLEAAPELYRNADGSADWSRVADGGVLSIPVTIDNTAPQVLSIRQEGEELVIQAKDNQYIAAVALMNSAGTGVLDIIPGDQETANTTLTAKLDLSGVFGRDFLVAVYDYAENVTVCSVELQLDHERPRFTVVDQESGIWYGLDDSGSTVQLTYDGIGPVQAAEYVDGYVFAVDGSNRLCVASDEDLYGFRPIAELDPEETHKITKFQDLAYSTADRSLYGLFYSNLNSEEESYLCRINIYTGEMTVVGTLSADICAMTIDDSGKFYGVPYGTAGLYSFTADAVTTGTFTNVGGLGSYNTVTKSPMAWDHETDELFWAQVDNSGTELLRLNSGNGAAELLFDLPFQAAGLYIAGRGVGDTFAPTSRVTAVRVKAAEKTVAGGTVQLSAQVLPWNVSDDTVTWSSGNPKVATVDQNGLVTGISGGTAVITATSRLDSTKKASCTVTVEQLGNDLKGLVWDEEGGVWFASFAPGSLPGYKKLAAVDLPLATTAYHNGTLYAGTLDTSGGFSDLYTVNPKTYALTRVGGSAYIAYTDMCYAPKLNYLMATYFNYLALVDPQTGEYMGVWDWGPYVKAELVGVTHLGSEYNSSYEAWVDVFLILDADGNVYRFGIMLHEGQFGSFVDPGEDLVGNMGEPVSMDYFQGFHFDGKYLYWTRFNEADNMVQLKMMDLLGSGRVYELGCFPEGVWPVGGLYTDAQVSANALTSEYAVKSLREQVFTDSLDIVPERGSLNAVQTAAADGADGLSHVDVTYDRDTTNGILRVEYDAALLDFVSLNAAARGLALREEPGAVELAFAHGSAIAAGEPVISLGFRAKDGVLGGETTVTIHTRELGRETVALKQTLAVAIPLPHNPFTDVPEGSFYHIPVLWAVQKGITSGMDDTHFGPGAACTRAQVVTFLYSAAGKPPVTGRNPFADVPAGSWFEKAVIWAVENGITSGTDATHFSPGAACTRAQVVTFLYGAKGRPAVTGENPFTDVPAGAWFEKPVLWAKANGITSGVSPTEFGTNTVCNRAQVVTFLYKAYGE